MAGNYKENDKLVLHSIDGHDYDVVVVNVNGYRPPNSMYAVDMINDQGVHWTDIHGDYLFCSADFLSQCERVTS